MVHAQARDRLEDPQDLLARREGGRHDRRRAHLVATGAEADEVGRDAVELHEEHADDARTLGDVVGDAEELLDAEAERDLLEERREVVHARAVGHALGPGAELHVLLDARVQVADPRAGLGDGLTVDLEHEAQHAVRRRVLRPHVDDDALLAEPERLLGDVGPVAVAVRLEGGDVAVGPGRTCVAGRVRCRRGCGAHE